MPVIYSLTECNSHNSHYACTHSYRVIYIILKVISLSLSQIISSEIIY